jgi:hypothetical protein
VKGWGVAVRGHPEPLRGTIPNQSGPPRPNSPEIFRVTKQHRDPAHTNWGGGHLQPDESDEAAPAIAWPDNWQTDRKNKLRRIKPIRLRSVHIFIVHKRRQDSSYTYTHIPHIGARFTSECHLWAISQPAPVGDRPCRCSPVGDIVARTDGRYSSPGDVSAP